MRALADAKGGALQDVHIDLVTEGRLNDILAHGFDAALRLASVVPQDMIAISLGIPESLILVGSPVYLAAKGHPQTPGDLLGHECIRARLPSGAMMDWELSQGSPSGCSSTFTFRSVMRRSRHVSFFHHVASRASSTQPSSPPGWDQATRLEVARGLSSA